MIRYPRVARAALLATVPALLAGCAVFQPVRGAAGGRAPDAACSAALSRAQAALAAAGAPAAPDDAAGAARVAAAHAEHAAAMAEYHACLSRAAAP